jgi:four helix bundle protein
VRYLGIARGSLFEVNTLLVFIERLDLVQRAELEGTRARADRTSRALWGLRRAVLRKVDSAG